MAITGEFVAAHFTITTGTETDIFCLKSIKDSVIDPYAYLDATWDFNNYTEGFICSFVGVECWHPDEDKVLNIRLADLRLKGQFPSGFENCTSLTSLNLSYNKFQGQIPSDICKRLPHITSLDLSFNNFSGEIPASMANCTYLNHLIINNNQLIGHIPPQIGQLNRIKFFNVSNNLLSGQVPNFVNATVSEDSYANNEGLCGGPLQKCSTHRSKSKMKFDYSFKSGFVIGYAVCATSVVVVFISYCVPWVYVGKKNKKITVSEMVKLMRRRKHNRTVDDQADNSPTAELLVEGTKEISLLEKRVTRMSYADLHDATYNFSENNIIGEGKMGILYKASLPNGYVLAVKKLHHSHFLEKQFISELKILGSFRHVNLLPLLGFCIESKQRLLVYKYMPNGNLYDWLHPKEEGQAKIMKWGVRVKVAMGLARGLAWLHQKCHTVRIIHLDISSKCILLDKNFQPKLSNFGEAMLMSSTDNSSVNSEFWEMAFVKEDVHGFGVVLLELITGVDFSNIADSSNSILNERIDHLLSSSNSYSVIDKSLIGQGFDTEILQMLKIARNCVDSIPGRRPTMLQLYDDIKAIRERCEHVNDSDMLMQPQILPVPSENSTVEIEIAES
ncbi:unnamed protein product [Dovyalis caffra]|uniref:non-specific serine/threonine protein kinase n=1 Tax=Dovyalis caffra TaxID=77055 RepID=A0AAV1QTE5_9ROSI|nr:unnamed protein product [Dovyalis caffra]